MDLALNNLQREICNKAQTTKLSLDDYHSLSLYIYIYIYIGVFGLTNHFKNVFLKSSKYSNTGS